MIKVPYREAISVLLFASLLSGCAKEANPAAGLPPFLPGGPTTTSTQTPVTTGTTSPTTTPATTSPGTASPTTSSTGSPSTGSPSTGAPTTGPSGSPTSTPTTTPATASPTTMPSTAPGSGLTVAYPALTICSGTATVSGLSERAFGCPGIGFFTSAGADEQVYGATGAVVNFTSPNSNVTAVQNTSNSQPDDFSVNASQSVEFTASTTGTFTDSGSGKAVTVPITVIQAGLNPIETGTGGSDLIATLTTQGSATNACPGGVLTLQVTGASGSGALDTSFSISSNDSSVASVNTTAVSVSGGSYSYNVTVNKTGTTYLTVGGAGGATELLPINVPYVGLAGC